MSGIATPWHLAAIGLRPSHAGPPPPTGKGITIAVLDTGIDATHPDLAGRVHAAYEIDPSASDPQRRLVPLNPATNHDRFGHGTCVAGLICSPQVGPAPDARLISIIFPRSTSNYSRIQFALEAVAQLPEVQVMNLSAGVPYPLDSVLQGLIDNLLQNEVFPVVGVGNQRSPGQPPLCPGDLPGSLTVGSCNRQNQVSAFSRSGSLREPSGASYIKPDLVAPGESVYTTFRGGGHREVSGTSYATGIVSGVAALILEGYPSLPIADLRRILLSSCRTLNEAPDRQGAGLVQVPNALMAAGRLGPTNPNGGP